MIRVGIAGIGFMGMIHYLSYEKVRGIKVAAICSRSSKHRSGDWRDIQGNFGPRGTKMDLSGVTVYSALNDLICDPNLDLIDITLPPAMHPDVAIRAMKAGKHVFCEKPMALSVNDCRRMMRTASTTNQRLLIGHTLPFVPEYEWALNLVRSGKYGKLLGGSFKRRTCEPKWLKHFWSAKRVGGPMLDLHVHDAHFIRLLFGMPKVIMTHGKKRGELAEHWDSLFCYDRPDIAVHATSGITDQTGRSFEHGFEICLEKATLAFEFAVTENDGIYHSPPTVCDIHGRTHLANLGESDTMNAFVAELKEVANCLRQNRESSILDPTLACDAVRLCQKQTQSLAKGRSIRL